MRRLLPLLLLALAAAAVLLWPRPVQDPTGSQDASGPSSPAVPPRLATAGARPPATADPKSPEAKPSAAPYRFEVVDDAGPLVGVVLEVFHGADVGTTDALGRLTVLPEALGRDSGPVEVLARKSGYVTGAEIARPGDVCKFHLVRGTSIHGRVVRAPGDRPVAGATVVAERGIVLGRVQSDAKGEFDVADVPAGVPIEVHVRVPGRVTAHVTAIAPEEVHVRLEEGGVLIGTVTDSAGKAMASVPVYLLSPEETLSVDAQSGPRDGLPFTERASRTITDASGAYEIADVEIGKPSVAVATPGSAWIGRSEPVAFSEVGERMRRDIVVPVPGGLRVAVEGGPRAGREEVAYVIGPHIQISSFAVTRAPDGSWLFPALTPDRYQVRLVTLGAPFVGRVAVVEPGKVTDVVLSYRFSKSVEGRVVREDGTAVARAMIWWSGASATITEADADGRFWFDGLDERPGVLIATRIASDPKERLARTVLEGVVPGTAGPVRLVLGPKAGVRVHLPELEPGARVASDLQARWDQEFGLSATVSVDRTVDLSVGVLGIPTAITLRADQRPPLRLEVAPLAAGELRDVGERLFGAGRTVSLRVVEANGKAVAGAKVARGDEDPRDHVTNAAGETALARMQLEAFPVAVEVEGRPAYLFTIPAETTAPVVLRLEQEGTLEVRVVERDDTPAAAAALTILPAEEDPYGYEPDAWTQSVRTDAAGAWHAPVQPRTFRVRARNLSGEARATETATVRPGETTTLRIRLP